MTDTANKPSDQDSAKAKFRQQVNDHIYASNRKPFLISTPPGAGLNVILFLGLLIGLFAALRFVQLPISLQAEGEVIVGGRHFSVQTGQDNQILKQWIVRSGDKLTVGQAIAKLEQRDQKNISQQLLNYSNRLTFLSNQLKTLEKDLIDATSLFTIRKKDQEALVEAANSRYKQAQEVENVYSQNVDDGLINRQTLFQQQDTRAGAYTLLKQQKAQLSEILLEKNLYLQSSRQRKETIQLEYERISQSMNAQSGEEVLVSPCDCEVADIFVEQDSPTIKGSALATLWKSSAETTVQLYFRADQFRPIKVGSALSISFPSYPSMKYGKLRAIVVGVSTTSVSGTMLNRSYLLQEHPYFIVTANLPESHSDLAFLSGMRVESNVVVDHQSLFSLLFTWE